MKRSPLLGLLLPVLLSCTRGEVPPGPTQPTPTPRPTPRPTTPTPTTPVPTRPPDRSPPVRIGIAVDTNAVEIVVPAGARIVLTTQAGGEQTVSMADDRWTVTAEGGTLQARSSRGPIVTVPGESVTFIPADGGTITIAGRNYRGNAVVLRRPDGKLTAINALDMETYLRGVVPNEIGRLAPALIEAVKAQAIAARTYAIGNMNRWGSRGFDFYATVQDQVYRGVTDEDSVANRAVEETRGEIVSYDGKPIFAYYSSTCGGRTAGIREVWPWRENLPYLKSVPDTIGNTEGAYCQNSNRYRWTVAWTRESLRTILGETFGARARRALRIERPDSTLRMNIRRVQNVEVTERTESGRARFVSIRFDGETHRIPADSIRWLLRPENRALLNSSYLIEVNPQIEDGEVSHLEVKGGGWGHAIGMCQVGAIGRARAGQSYRQILLTYYSGTTIDRLY